jgi:hypothetical protein
VKAGNSRIENSKERIMRNLAVGLNGTKLFAIRSASILLVFATLAVSTLAQGADSKSITSDHGNIVRLVTPQKGGATFKGPEADGTDYNILLAQQAAPWCYTNYGTFPMFIALPPGVGCSVRVPYWPYVVYGVTGY